MVLERKVIMVFVPINFVSEKLLPFLFELRKNAVFWDPETCLENASLIVCW